MSSHMIVCTVYSYSTEKAKQEKVGGKKEKEFVGPPPALRCDFFFLDVNYAPALALICVCVCVYVCMLCLHEHVSAYVG